MQQRTRNLYPLRRLVELIGTRADAAKGLCTSAETVEESLRTGSAPEVLVLAAECLLRRMGPQETSRAVLLVAVEDPARMAGLIEAAKPFGLAGLHWCHGGKSVVASAPWRNVGSIEELAKVNGGRAERLAER